MTFVVALREARRWKRLRPLWSPQQRGCRSSFMGLPNLMINSYVPRACCCCDLCYQICSSWFVFLPNSPPRVWTRSTKWWPSGVKEATPTLHLTTRSGVVRYLSLKVHFSICSAIVLGTETPGCLRRNFWVPKVPAQTIETSDYHWHLTLRLRKNF